MRQLERTLDIPREKLRDVAAHAGAYYRPFPSERKARPFQRKPVGKKRLIDNPIEPLAYVQKRINARLLRPLSIPDYLFGGVKGKTVLDNVAIHIGNRNLVKIDIKSFFPSVTNAHVYFVWRDVLGCGSEVASLLTKLTTVDGHLPQGAATSTTLANLVLASIDGEIRQACAAQAISYSTWVDDLAFSGATPKGVIPIVIRTLRQHGFRVSRKKLEVLGPGDRRVLNGILMSRRPSVVRERIGQLRAGLHRLSHTQFSAKELQQYIRRLRGSLQQVETIAPTKVEKLKRGLPPPFPQK